MTQSSGASAMLAGQATADELLLAAKRRGRLRAARRHLPAQAALVLSAALFLVPFFWLLSTSLKTVEQTGQSPPIVFPIQPQWHNYRDVWNHEKLDFPLYLRNTVAIALLTVAGTLVSSSLAAYGFAKIRFRGRGVLFAVLLGTMMIPFPVTMVALFNLYRWVGEHLGLQMLGTNRPLWVWAWFGSAFNIFLLRQFFLTIPDELLEAARIDGCGELGIFFRVMLPLARPALVVVALFSFLASWNDFLGPLLYLQRPEQYTLALGLASFQSTDGTPWHLLMAAAAMIVVPVLVLFFVAQKTFVEGIATTGMKG